MASAPGAKTALIERLSARPGLSGVLVQRALPTTTPSEFERIYVLGAKDLAHTERQGEVHETYDLPCLVEVHNVGGTAVATEERTWVLAEEIQAQLREDDELGGAVWRGRVALMNEETFATTDGWITKIEVRLEMGVVVDG